MNPSGQVNGGTDKININTNNNNGSNGHNN